MATVPQDPSASRFRFRAWSKKQGKFLHQRHLANPRSCPVVPQGRTFRLNDKHVVFQQSTGLTDKNGREGFEGDITRDQDDQLWSIYWASGVAAFRLQTIPERDYRDLIDSDFEDDFEIIGNIYENPELLA